MGDEPKLLHYRNCLAFYGAVIAQAYLNLTNDLSAFETSNNGQETIIKGIGYDDLRILARGALDRAIGQVETGAENTGIKIFYNWAVDDKSPCYLSNSSERILCGSSLVVLGTVLGARPQLIVSGVKFYGENTYAGFTGTYRVSTGWSYSKAIENLKSSSKYRKFATNVAKYADTLTAKGKSTEAVMLKKKAFDLAKSGKQTVSLARLIPGLN